MSVAAGPTLRCLSINRAANPSVTLPGSAQLEPLVYTTTQAADWPLWMNLSSRGLN